MAEIAAAYPRKAVSVREISDRQKISSKYLEHIVRELKKAGLIMSVRGAGGGYTLTRPPSNIKISDIYNVLEEHPELIECINDPDTCDTLKSCPTFDTWVELSKAITKVLDNTTLLDLAKKMVPDYNEELVDFQI